MVLMDNYDPNEEIAVHLNRNDIKNNAILGTEHNINENKQKKRKNRYLGIYDNIFVLSNLQLSAEIAFMSCVTGGSLLFGFSSALSSAKKKDVNAFDKV